MTEQVGQLGSEHPIFGRVGHLIEMLKVISRMRTAPPDTSLSTLESIGTPVTDTLILDI